MARAKPQKKPEVPAEPSPPQMTAPSPEMLQAARRGVVIGSGWNLMDQIERSSFTAQRKVALRRAVVEAILEDL